MLTKLYIPPNTWFPCTYLYRWTSSKAYFYKSCTFTENDAFPTTSKLYLTYLSLYLYDTSSLPLTRQTKPLWILGWVRLLSNDIIHGTSFAHQYLNSPNGKNRPLSDGAIEHRKCELCPRPGVDHSKADVDGKSPFATWLTVVCLSVWPTYCHIFHCAIVRTCARRRGLMHLHLRWRTTASPGILSSLATYVLAIARARQRSSLVRTEPGHFPLWATPVPKQCKQCWTQCI